MRCGGYPNLREGGGSEGRGSYYESPSLFTIHQKNIMTPIVELTISEAVNASKINRSTLNSWVQKKKVKSRKICRGKKEIIFIDFASLEEHLSKRPTSDKPYPASSPEPANPQATKADTDLGLLSVQDCGGNSPTESNSESNSESNTESNTESKNATRSKSRSKPPRQHAKNLMRSFTNAELLNVQCWIIQRLESRLGAVDAPSGA